MSFSLNWSEREEVISGLLSDLSSDFLDGESPEVLDVYWSKNADAGSFTNSVTQAVCELSTVSCVPYGLPQRKTNVDEDTGETRLSILQHFVWTVRVTCYALDTSDPMQSISWTERLRSTLYRDESGEALATIDCGIQRVLPTTPLGNVKRDGRNCDASSFDLVLNTESLYVDPNTRPPIEHVEIEARWNDPEADAEGFVNIDYVTP